MKTIEAYESVDGTIFKNKEDAEKHDIYCIRKTFRFILDDVITPDCYTGEVDKHRIASHFVKNRVLLEGRIKKLVNYLENA